jgi:hypothetical protein
MNRFALATILLSVIAAASDVGLAMATAAAWTTGQPSYAQLAFVAGPFLFLILLAWRRRHHAARSRFLFMLALFATTGGLAVLGYDYIRIRQEPPNHHTSHSHPLIVSLIQWVTVMGAWIVLAIQEGREKQAANKTP